MAAKKIKKWIGTLLALPANSDRLINGCTVFLMLFGMMMTASASISSKDSVVSEVMMSTLRQGSFVLTGLLLYHWISHTFSWEIVRRYIFVIFIAETVLLLVTRLFGSTNGSYAWIRIPNTYVSIQPSEFAKVIIVLIMAVYLGNIGSRRYKSGWDIMKMPLVALIVFVGIILVVQSDLGSAVIVMALGCLTLLLPSHRQLRPFQIFVTAGIAAVIFMVWFFMTDRGLEILSKVPLLDYMIARFKSAADPLADRYNTSYQLVNSLIGLARGKLWGVGLGNSIQKFGYLTYADTDFIFAIVVEELGLIGVLAIFVPYGIILFRLFLYAVRIQDMRDKMFLIGTGAMLFIHLFLNVGGVTALIPLTGVPLLLISRGGSSLWATMLMLGICQNIISRHNSRLKIAAQR